MRIVRTRGRGTMAMRVESRVMRVYMSNMGDRDGPETHVETVIIQKE